MTHCPFHAWAFLPLEARRRLRSVYEARGGVMGDNRTPVAPERLEHLADRPRCVCISAHAPDDVSESVEVAA